MFLNIVKIKTHRLIREIKVRVRSERTSQKDSTTRKPRSKRSLKITSLTPVFPVDRIIEITLKRFSCFTWFDFSGFSLQFTIEWTSIFPAGIQFYYVNILSQYWDYFRFVNHTPLRTRDLLDSAFCGWYY